MDGKRFGVLDGWRGISILAVLACHLLPLGPKDLQLNVSAGLFGMAVFFCLSGFLITHFLLVRGDVRDFLIRRLCRIVPLAWLGLLVGLPLAHARIDQWIPNFLFFANLPPFWLTSVTGHYWSLGVEVQFYAGVALLYGLFGRWGLLIGIPVAAAIVTGIRVHFGTFYSIVTYERVDEILAGGILAIIYHGRFGEWPKRALRFAQPLPLLILFCASTNSLFGPIGYARPYLAAALVGSTLFGSERAFGGLLLTRTLAYIAEISYALYIIHPILGSTWLGTGSKLVKYAKRPLLLGATFLCAHVSTRYYERRWIEFGKRLSSRWNLRSAAAA